MASPKCRATGRSILTFQKPHSRWKAEVDNGFLGQGEIEETNIVTHRPRTRRPHKRSAMLANIFLEQEEYPSKIFFAHLRQFFIALFGITNPDLNLGVSIAEMIKQLTLFHAIPGGELRHQWRILKKRPDAIAIEKTPVISLGIPELTNRCTPLENPGNQHIFLKGKENLHPISKHHKR